MQPSLGHFVGDQNKSGKFASQGKSSSVKQSNHGMVNERLQRDLFGQFLRLFAFNQTTNNALPRWNTTDDKSGPEAPTR